MKNIVGVISLLLFVQMANAQQLTIQRPSAYGTQNTLQPQLIRDFFTLSNLMYEVASNKSLLGTASNGFLPAQAGSAVPKMRLKGFIEQEGDNLALLEVNGAGTYMVKAGDEINYDSSQPRSAIRVTKVERNSVTVETGLIGTIRVKR
jgi:hypothetical protein